MNIYDKTDLDKARLFYSEINQADRLIEEINAVRNLPEWLQLMDGYLKKEMEYINKEVRSILHLNLFHDKEQVVRKDPLMSYGADQLSFLQHFTILQHLYDGETYAERELGVHYFLSRFCVPSQRGGESFRRDQFPYLWQHYTSARINELLHKKREIAHVSVPYVEALFSYELQAIRATRRALHRALLVEYGQTLNALGEVVYSFDTLVSHPQELAKQLGQHQKKLLISSEKKKEDVLKKFSLIPVETKRYSSSDVVSKLNAAYYLPTVPHPLGQHEKQDMQGVESEQIEEE